MRKILSSASFGFNFNTNRIRRFLLLLLLFVASIISYSQSVLTLGTGLLTSYYYGPVYRSSTTSTFNNSRYAYIYTASELGIPAGSVITKVEWALYSGTLTGPGTSFSILMSNSTSTSLTSGSTWGTLSTGATTVYTSSAQNFSPALSWLAFNLSTPFTYTGGSLQILTSYSRTTASTSSGALNFLITDALGKSIGAASNSALTNATTLTTLYGDYRPDIKITYTPPPCTGTPAPGNTISSPSTGVLCLGQTNASVNLQLQNQSSLNFAGITYQWQTSSNGSAWTNISGATSSTYAASIPASTYFRCAVTCSGNTAFSNSTLVNVTPAATLPYSEGFETISAIGPNLLPSCWASQTGSNPWTSSNSASNAYNDPRTGNQYMTVYYGTSMSYLWAPVFPMTAGNTYRLKFYFVGDNYDGWTGNIYTNSSQSSTGATLRANFLQSTTVTSSSNYTLVSYDFVPTTSGNFAFGIGVSSNSTPYYLGIDDVSIEQVASCSAPLNQPISLSFSGITAAKVDGSFTSAVGSPSGYLVIRTNSSTPPSSPVNGVTYPTGANALGGLIVANSPNTSFTSTGLTGATTYFYWVYSYNSNCIGADPTYNTSNPLTASVTTLPCSLTGDKAIGTATGSDYPTLTAALADLDIKGLAGPVVFNLASSYNSASETFPISLSRYSCGSNINTLTIKPASGTAATISGTVSSGALISLKGSNYIIIDGSNNGTNTRDLTLINNSNTSPSCISISSLGIGSGASNNVIKNTNITTGLFSGSYGIALGGNVPGSSGADNDNNAISNNLITTGGVGIFSSGSLSSTIGANDGLLISSNTITATTTTLIKGIQLINSTGSTVSKNSISLETTSTTPVAISIEAGVTSTTISSNIINKVLTTNTSGYGGRGIVVATSIPNSNVTVSNNIIFGVNGSNFSAFSNSSSMGIGVGVDGNSTTLSNATGGVNVYNNTVRMSGSYSYGSNCITTALYVGSAATSLDIINNIFANTLSNTNSSGASSKNYAIYSAAPVAGFTRLDNNNYFTSGGQGVLGFLGSDLTSLAAIRAVGGNASSVVFNPQFVSATDLHLSTTEGVNWTLESAGAPISTVTTDIDGDARNATTPDIGADEFNASSFVVTNPAAVCAPNTVDITAAAVTAGTTSGTTFTYWTNAAGTITLTTPAAVAASGTYYIKATFGSADNYWIKPVVVVVNPLPTPSITGAAVLCEASTGNVYSVANVAGNTYNWTVTGGTITAGQGTNSITVTWGAAGTATVTVTQTITATGCAQTATRSITLNPNPTPVITGLAAVCTTNEGYVYSVPSVAGNTYAWSVGGGTITAGAGTNAITVTWGAVGAGSVTVTQTVTATGCATTVSRVTNIQELPTATAAVVQPVTCASEDGQINLTLGGAVGPYTFAWTGTGNGLSPTTQNQTVVSTGFYNVVVTAANGCTTSLTNVVVAGPGGCFICPTIGTLSSTATIICQDGSNTIRAGGLADLGITYGIRFKYSATPLANPYLSTAGITMGTVSNANLTVVGGTVTSTSASINFNFPTAGTMYVYAILSPASPDPACRPFLMIPVEVAPTPVLTRPADQVRCTGSATGAVNFIASPVTTTSFTWTNTRTSIGLAASGSGNIASFTATNFTNAPVTAFVTVTPTNTQTLGASTVVCPGPAQTYSYTVNPIPTVNTMANQSVCAGTTVSLPFSGFVPGTVFEWTNSNAAIGLAASGAGTLSYTATNNTSSPITATIIVTPKFTNGGVTCTGNPISFDITVNPTPAVDAIPAQVLCSGSATTAISLTSATTGTAFSWTNSATSIGLAGTGTGTSIASFTAVNTGAAPVNAIIRITPSFTGAGFTCTGAVGTTTITVNPVPATTGLSNRVICNGAATTFTLTGPVTAAVYNWTNSNTAIGLAGTGSGTIAFTASNTTGAPISSTIEVTPSVSNAGLTCVGGTSSFTVTVNPSGQVNAIDNQVLCNGSATSAVTFSTVNNGLISTGGTQVASSGTISVVVPDASAVGATHTIPVTLPTGAVITNMRVTLNLSHTWISDMIINLRAPNGEVLNLFNRHGGSGVNLVNTVISSTGTTSLASGTAPFTGTFAATAAAGVGPTGNASTAANFAALYAVANGNWVLALRDMVGGDIGTLTSWSISFDYTVQGQFGTNMNWTNSLSSIGLAASGTGNIPSFTAANTTAAPVVSTVTVTPVYFNSGTSCPGTPATFTYTVNPTPTVNAVANQVFCAGTPATVNLSGATTGTVYNWTSSNTAIGLAASGSGNLSFTPTNTSNVPIASTITVTPVFTNAGVTCTGTPRTFTITVNPVGQVNTVSNQVLCNGANMPAINFATVNGGGTVQVGTPVTVNSGAITVAVPDASAVGATHSLPVTLPAGATITGVSVTFSMTHTWVSDMVFNLRAPNGQILNLVNRRGGAGVNFTNTTISSASTNSLAGGAAPFTGTFAADAVLNTGPTNFVSSATNFAALYSVANGDWTLGMRDFAIGDVGTLTGWSITFNYTTVQGAVTTYSWTNNTPSIGLAASGVGNIASFPVVNTSTVPVTATVSITPTYTNAGVGCAGPPTSFLCIVNPTPNVNAVTSQTVCRGSNVAAINFGGTVSGTVYNWTNTNTAIGLAASGTGNIASFVGTNTTSAPISGTITVTPVFTNAGVTCTGTPRTFTITVNPIPTVNSVASFPICHNSVAAVAFSGASTGTVYNWTNTNTSIGLPASGSGDLNFTALNTTSVPQVATITVTPVFASGGTTCTGTPTSFTITVNPLPVVSAGTLPARICISDTLVPLNGTPMGGSWSGIGTSGMNFVPTATAVGTWPITYNFSDLNGCTNRATIAATVLSCDERDRDLDNSAVLLYPNPNTGLFNLRVNSTRFNALGMRVFNTAGQLVSTKMWSGLVYARVIPVDLSSMPAGIYMVRLYYGDGMDRGADKTYQIIIAR